MRPKEGAGTASGVCILDIHADLCLFSVLKMKSPFVSNYQYIWIKQIKKQKVKPEITEILSINGLWQKPDFKKGFMCRISEKQA